MDIVANRVVGSSIRRLRIRAGMSQQELARRVGRSQSEVAKIEMGERRLSYIDSFVYAEALGEGYAVLAEEIRADLLAAGFDPDHPRTSM